MGNSGNAVAAVGAGFRCPLLPCVHVAHRHFGAGHDRSRGICNGSRTVPRKVWASSEVAAKMKKARIILTLMEILLLPADEDRSPRRNTLLVLSSEIAADYNPLAHRLSYRGRYRNRVWARAFSLVPLWNERGGARQLPHVRGRSRLHFKNSGTHVERALWSSGPRPQLRLRHRAQPANRFRSAGSVEITFLDPDRDNEALDMASLRELADGWTELALHSMKNGSKPW